MRDFSLQGKWIEKYGPSRYFPSPEKIKRIVHALEQDLEEMNEIVGEVVKLEKELEEENGRILLLLGSYLYDYYQVVEESLLLIASHIDRYAPGSLDWHNRLLKLLSAPREEVRPQVLAPATASLLEKYMYFYLFFHRHLGHFTPEKIGELAGGLEKVNLLLKQDFTRFCRVLKALGARKA